ncbi:XRE family transcriptional regulator [Streptomyces sp. NPDC004838]
MRRRRLLGGLAVTAAAAAGIPLPSGSPQPDTDAAAGNALVAGLRDAMLGIGARPPGTELPDTLLERALAAFHVCDYTALAVLLPAAIRTGHADGTDTCLARAYVLATRMLVKLDEQQLGWMAADRARQYAGSTGDPMQSAEAARQLAVLARRAGWHDQALSIALAAADDPALRTTGPDGAAQRGLLVQSAAYTAAYTAARAGDADGMRELTDEAVAIATALRGITRLRHHGGGFSPATIQLHLVSAENAAGDPSRALTAAKALIPRQLPTVERQARYYSDVATAYAAWGRRDDCVRALLAAERMAPQETHTRSAVRSMVQGLLVSGRTTTELRGLAARSGLTF